METINDFSGKYFFLSNFAHAKVYMGDREYETNEHFYQAGKANTTFDHELVRTAGGPGAAKRAGRKIEMRPDWNDIREQYMLLGLRLKFDIKELGDLLLETGDAHLEEGNTWGDTFWGTVDGVGENKLGKALMKVRNEILERRSKIVTTTTQEEATLVDIQ